MNTRTAMAGLGLMALISAACGDNSAGDAVNSSTTRIAPISTAVEQSQAAAPSAQTQSTAVPAPTPTSPLAEPAETWVPPATEQEPEPTPPVYVPPVEESPATSTDSLPPIIGTAPGYPPTCANFFACVPGSPGGPIYGPDPDVNLPEDQ